MFWELGSAHKTRCDSLHSYGKQLWL